VFALLAHRDKATIDPLDLSQWQFFVLATPDLIRDGERRCISLKSVQQLCPTPCDFYGLGNAIETVALPQYRSTATIAPFAVNQS